eukprot:12694038-Prorocentrum_lima.AAC.1
MSLPGQPDSVSSWRITTGSSAGSSHSLPTDVSWNQPGTRSKRGDSHIGSVINGDTQDAVGYDTSH